MPFEFEIMIRYFVSDTLDADSIFVSLYLPHSRRCISIVQLFPAKAPPFIKSRLLLIVIREDIYYTFYQNQNFYPS